MKEKLIAFFYFLGACLLLLFIAKVILAPVDPHKNIPVNWQAIQELGIQQGGRLMPLDSFSRVLLTQFSGKSSIKIDNKKMTSIEWLARTVFERSTDDYALFLIENPDVLDALKVKYNTDRDWYSYNTLKEKMPKMTELAKQAASVEQEKRDLVQNQIIHLHNNVTQFQDLRNSFSFWERKKGMTGANKFYGELVLQLEKIYKEKNASLDKFYKEAIQEIISFDFKRTQSVSISEYLYHLYASLEIFRHYDMKHEMQEIINIENSLHNSEIRANYSALLNIIPPSKHDHHDHAHHDHDDHDGHNHDHDHNHEHEDDSWKSPWFIFYTKFDKNDERKEALVAYNHIYHEFNQKNWHEMNAAIADLSSFNKKLVDTKQSDNLKLEVTYNQYDFFFYAMILYLLTAFYCLFAWLGWTKKPFIMGAIFLLILAYCFHTSGIVMRMVLKSRPPVSTLYESILFAAWVGVSIAGIMEYLSRASKSVSLFIGALTGYILLAIAGKYAIEGDNFAVLVAVLDSNFWLSTHVTSMIIGYSACMVAGALGHLYIFMNLIPNMDKKRMKEVGKLIYGTLCFGTIVAFLGTILGGLWADQSWGRFWGWDPKENGAMLIVLWSVVLLHARLGGYIRDWGLAIGAIFGNIVVAAAWWGVNLLSVGLHNYGFTQGLFTKLAIFTVIELAFMVFGMVVCYNQRAAKANKIAEAT